MKIALCHFRVGETDGVSLEMDKWKKALELSGHEVIYIAGSAGNCEAQIIPSLHYQHPINNKIVENAYCELNDYASEKELEKEVYDLAGLIETELINIINNYQIDLIVPNNILSLGWGLSAGIAFTRAIEKTEVNAICHHHDFHWERELYSHPKVGFVKDLLKTYFPPVHKRIAHVCINQIAKDELKKRYDVDAKVVPNVFEFEQELIVRDDYNKNLRAELGLEPADIVFLQATRIVERKAIELAIDLLAELMEKEDELKNRKLYKGFSYVRNSKMVLVLAGKNESPEYYRRLQNYADAKGVNLLDMSDVVSHERKGESGKKIYSLWDAYSIADIVTYPSILEGWGNQFLEAIVARLPVATYKYPVFLTDIEPFHFNVISLGSEHVEENDLVKVKREILQEAAKECLSYLLDDEYRRKHVEQNYSLASKHLSVKSLKDRLRAIFGNGKN